VKLRRRRFRARGRGERAIALFLPPRTLLLLQLSFSLIEPLAVIMPEPRVVAGSAALRTLLVAAPAVAAALWLRFSWGGTGVGFPYLTPWSVSRRPWFGSMDS
jgi:hypothetical protein